jgi:flagellar hook-associated protein 1 FlgK
MKIPGTVDDITYSVTDASGNVTTTSIVGTTQTVTVEDSLGNPIGVPVVTTIKPVLLWDKKNAPIGNDTDKSERQELFERKSTERYTKASMTVTDGATTNTYDVYIYNQEEPTNNYSLYTLGEIKINDKIKNNYSMLPLSANNLSGKAGAYDIATCDKLLNAWKTDFATLDPNTLTKNNFDEYYTAFIGGIANKGDVFDTIATNQKSMVESIDGQRQQVAGVSSDEELTNLIKFQHGYNAAARYISVIDQMLEHVVTRL